ncbi:MAG TPA: EAL domain-containing protein [Steroidobacteraceae bacterium]|jgi:diguanylate cyclase (GGDEF)-like protein/PAS domain S-box-containing protein|nr:EAL domain-containing protein [Steroidobacteraceae bacterium]
MSILGLICVLLALVATLLLVLFMFQRRDLRAIAELSLTVQRAISGERLPQRIEIDEEHEGQLDVQALGVSVNQLLLRASRTSGRERAGPKLFTELGERIHEAVLVHREVILYANSQFASFVGVDRVELIDRRLSDLVAPEYAELVGENLRRRLAGAHGAERFEVEMVGLQGQVSLLELTTAQIDFEGAPALLVTGVEVIPTKKLRALASGKIDEKEAAARAALVAPPLPPPPPPAPPPQVFAVQSLGEAIVTTDIDGRLVYLNPAAEKLLGVGSAQAVGRLLEEVVGLMDQNDRKLLADPIREAVGGGNGTPHNLSRRAVLLGKASGEERAIELAASPLRDEAGELVGAVVLLHDVTELRGLHRQMSYQATHDALTGLVNRREFERRLDEAAEAARRGEAPHMLCYLDLDRFKIVNDTSGHLAGDSMLREVAKLLREAVRDSDTVARLGGDEFGMLLVGCPLDKARQIADDVCRSIAAYRFVWHDRVFNIGVSIGLIEIGREAGSVEQLLAAADSACYVAKKEGAGRVSVYSARDEALARSSGEIEWLQKLQSALKEERFTLYYQPIVAAYGGETDGPSMEVLLRMVDETGAEIAPLEFVAAAERYRLMASVDRWVVQTTLSALSRNAFQLAPERSVAINISGQTLGDPLFLEFVVECLDTTGVGPAQLCFEITESAVIGNMDAARRFVGVLHGMGCKFTIDDFGSGVASFSSLKNLPLDYLKLDGSFMRNLAKDSVSQTMVTAMIKLARTLNFKIIAEQVEDSAALDVARKMGVDFVQGFVIARPARLALAA